MKTIWEEGSAQIKHFTLTEDEARLLANLAGGLTPQELTRRGFSDEEISTIVGWYYELRY